MAAKGYDGIHPSEVVSANKTLVTADSGSILLVDTDAVIITLPPTVVGLIYTFVCTAADGGALISVSPAAADAIHGSVVLAASVLEFAGADDKDIQLTKNTQNTGDYITLVGDGVVGWFVVAAVGIWASES